MFFNPAQTQSQMNSPFWAQMMQQLQGSNSMQSPNPAAFPVASPAPQLPTGGAQPSSVAPGGMNAQPPANAQGGGSNPGQGLGMLGSLFSGIGSSGTVGAGGGITGASGLMGGLGSMFGSGAGAAAGSSPLWGGLSSLMGGSGSATGLLSLLGLL